MTDRHAGVNPPKEQDLLTRESLHAAQASASPSKLVAQIPPNVRAFLDALAELLLDHVLAKRQNPDCPDPSGQRDVRAARSNPPQDRSGGSL